MSKMRLIDANALMDNIESWYNRIGETMNLSDSIIRNVLSSVMDYINEEETVDAVPLEEHECLLKRFRHLLKSDYIRSFDEVKRGTGEYKRDIKEADRENRHGRWIDESYGYRNCSECGCEHPILDANGFHLDDRYCPDCGAKMKEKM